MLRALFTLPPALVEQWLPRTFHRSFSLLLPGALAIAVLFIAHLGVLLLLGELLARRRLKAKRE